MANELQSTWNDPSATLYSVLINATGSVWNTSTSAVETPADANWTNDALAMTRQGTAIKFWYVDTPGSLPAGTYSFVTFRQDGGTPAVTDTMVGTGEITA